jgi:undecaprenyl-diphosphatase
MNPLQAIILGFIQGVTEWLPISSTGHLKIAEYFLGLTVPLLFDVILHIGTLIVTLVFFRRDIKNVLVALWKRDFKSEDGKLVPLIIVGTVPTAVIGVVFGNTLESFFGGILPIAGAFITFGVVIYISKFGHETSENISYVAALAIGTAQGIAIIPGVSRSGMTITLALLLGIKREKAFRFSFLLSIPSILGALGVTFYQQQTELTLAGVGLTQVLIGIAVAMVIGYLALKLLWRILAAKKFYLFAFYCWLIGIVLVALSLGGF